MMPPVRTLLNILCASTLLASCWLAAMSVILHRPGFERGVSLSLIFIIQSLLTLAITTNRLPALPWRLLAVAGAAGIIWAGGAGATNTLNGPHFEGYALVIGTGLVLQGLLTVGQLTTTCQVVSSKVHEFGN